MADWSNNAWNVLETRPGPVNGQGLTEAYIKQDDRTLPQNWPGWQTRDRDRFTYPYGSYLMGGEMRLHNCMPVTWDQLEWFATPAVAYGDSRTLDFPSVRQNNYTTEDGMPLNDPNAANTIRNQAELTVADQDRKRRDAELLLRGNPLKRARIEGPGLEGPGAATAGSGGGTFADLASAIAAAVRGGGGGSRGYAAPSSYGGAAPAPSSGAKAPGKGYGPVEGGMPDWMHGISETLKTKKPIADVPQGEVPKPDTGPKPDTSPKPDTETEKKLTPEQERDLELAKLRQATIKDLYQGFISEGYSHETAMAEATKTTDAWIDMMKKGEDEDKDPQPDVPKPDEPQPTGTMDTSTKAALTVDILSDLLKSTEKSTGDTPLFDWQKTGSVAEQEVKEEAARKSLLQTVDSSTKSTGVGSVPIIPALVGAATVGKAFLMHALRLTEEPDNPDYVLKGSSKDFQFFKPSYDANDTIDQKMEALRSILPTLIFSNLEYFYEAGDEGFKLKNRLIQILTMLHMSPSFKRSRDAQEQMIQTMQVLAPFEKYGADETIIPYNILSDEWFETTRRYLKMYGRIPDEGAPSGRVLHKGVALIQPVTVAISNLVDSTAERHSDRFKNFRSQGLAALEYLRSYASTEYARDNSDIQTSLYYRLMEDLAWAGREGYYTDERKRIDERLGGTKSSSKKPVGSTSIAVTGSTNASEFVPESFVGTVNRPIGILPPKPEVKQEIKEELVEEKLPTVQELMDLNEQPLPKKDKVEPEKGKINISKTGTRVTISIPAKARTHKHLTFTAETFDEAFVNLKRNERLDIRTQTIVEFHEKLYSLALKGHYRADQVDSALKRFIDARAFKIVKEENEDGSLDYSYVIDGFEDEAQMDLFIGEMLRNVHDRIKFYEEKKQKEEDERQLKLDLEKKEEDERQRKLDFEKKEQIEGFAPVEVIERSLSPMRVERKETPIIVESEEQEFKQIPSTFQNMLNALGSAVSLSGSKVYELFKVFMSMNSGISVYEALKDSVNSIPGQTQKLTSRLLSGFESFLLHYVNYWKKNYTKGIYDAKNDPRYLAVVDWKRGNPDMQRLWTTRGDEEKHFLGQAYLDAATEKWDELEQKDPEQYWRSLLHSVVVLESRRDERVKNKIELRDSSEILRLADYQRYLERRLQKVSELGVDGSNARLSFTVASPNSPYAFYVKWQNESGREEFPAESKVGRLNLPEIVPSLRVINSNIATWVDEEKQSKLTRIKNVTLSHGLAMGFALFTGYFVLKKVDSREVDNLAKAYRNVHIEKWNRSINNAPQLMKDLYQEFQLNVLNNSNLNFSDIFNLTLAHDLATSLNQSSFTRMKDLGDNFATQLKMNQPDSRKLVYYGKEKIDSERSDLNVPIGLRQAATNILNKNRDEATKIIQTSWKQTEQLLKLSLLYTQDWKLLLAQQGMNWLTKKLGEFKIQKIPLFIDQSADGLAQRQAYYEQISPLYDSLKVNEMLSYNVLPGSEGTSLDGFIDWLTTTEGQLLQNNLKGLAQEQYYSELARLSLAGEVKEDVQFDIAINSPEELRYYVSVLHDYTYPSFPGISELNSIHRWLLLFQPDNTVRRVAAANRELLFASSAHAMNFLELGDEAVNQAAESWVSSKELFIDSLITFSEGNLAQMYNWFGNSGIFTSLVKDYEELLQHLAIDAAAGADMFSERNYQRCLRFVNQVFNAQVYVSAYVMSRQGVIPPNLIDQSLYVNIGVSGYNIPNVEFG